MDPKLVDMYTNGVLLNEKKKSEGGKPTPLKASAPTKKNVVEPAKSRRVDFESDVDLTADFKKTGPSKVKNVKKPQHLKDSFSGFSKFDGIFRRALSEDAGLPASPEEGEPSEDVELPTSEEPQPEGAEEGAEEGSEEKDIVSDLQDVVSRLNDILQELGVEGEEGEEAGEGESEVNGDIDQVEGPESGEEPTAPEQGVSESLSDLKTAIHGLKTKLSTLTGKSNKVSTSLKVASGKAVGGDSVGKPLALNKTLQAKNNMDVTTKLKPGHNLFERRRQR